jgi:hypothetical protein
MVALSAVFFVLFLMPFAAMSLGFYTYRKGLMKGAFKYLPLILLILAAITVWILCFSGHVLSYNVPDDEEWLGIQALHATLLGQNPYAANFSATEISAFLFQKDVVEIPTATTRNMVIGIMDYPALYFLPLILVYPLAQFSVYSISHVYFPVSFGIFILALLFVMAYSSDIKYLSKPNLVAYAFAIFAVTMSSSVVAFLMLAILVLAYMKIESKYLFILLGIVASMQELLWVPVLLFLVYVFNTKGAKSGTLTLLGTLLVFLLINSYFIALSPAAYFHNLFAPISGSLFPSPYGAYGYLLLYGYPIPLSAFSLLFGCAVVVSLLLMAYHSNKHLIGMLSLFPLMFLYHGVPSYATFFIAFFILGFFVKEQRASERNKTKKSKAKKNHASMLERLTMGHARAVSIAVILAITAFAIVYIAVEHGKYSSGFDIRVYNGLLTKNQGNVSYSGTLSYNLRNKTDLYFIAYTFSRNITMQANTKMGLFNDSILLNSTSGRDFSHSNYSSLVNDNELTEAGSGTRNFSIIEQNRTITDLACAIYSGDFYYICPTASLSAYKQ